MKRLNVHVITKYFYPVAAGIETNILETYSKLASKWNITIHASADEYLHKNSLPKSEGMRGLHIARYPFASELTGYYADIDYKNADVVALHNFNIFFWRYFAATLYHKLTRQKKYRFILTPHGGFCPEWSMFPLAARVLKYFYHRLVGSVLINHLVDEVRAVSAWEKTEMVKMGVRENLITTITNGLEDEAFVDVDSLASSTVKSQVKKMGDYIIQIGRIYPIKNYETVIRSLSNVPNIKYMIVGQIEKSIKHTNYQRDLLSLAKKLHVEDRVIFFGIVRGIDKYYLLKHAKMMVHMALWESFCNVVHEGMSQGLVCIVANNTALPLLIKDGVNGFCVETKDSIKLSDKINYILDPTNAKMVRKMQEHNRTIGEGDSWGNVANKMAKLYQKRSK